MIWEDQQKRTTASSESVRTSKLAQSVVLILGGVIVRASGKRLEKNVLFLSVPKYCIGYFRAQAGTGGESLPASVMRRTASASQQRSRRARYHLE